MSQQSYLARHRQGRLYGPVEQPIVLRSGFDVKDFTYRAQGSLRPELNLAAFDRAPLDPAVLEDLRYLRDMERSTICLLYTSPSPRDRQKSRMPSSA